MFLLLSSTHPWTVWECAGQQKRRPNDDIGGALACVQQRILQRILVIDFDEDIALTVPRTNQP